MVVVVELHAQDGSTIRNLPDPNGGTFDAAGNFDRFVEAWPEHNPSLTGLVGELNATLEPSAMPALLSAVDECLPIAKEGPERRGLLRLRAMAERCRDDQTLHLVCIGE